jgi:hypothetical protein
VATGLSLDWMMTMYISDFRSLPLCTVVLVITKLAHWGGGGLALYGITFLL